jgi:Cd2+/Zn2+-exporting ATPase
MKYKIKVDAVLDLPICNSLSCIDARYETMNNARDRAETRRSDLGQVFRLEYWTAGACLVFTCVGIVLTHVEGTPSPWISCAFAVAYLAGGLMPLLRSLAMLRGGEFGVDLLMLAAAGGAAFTGNLLEGAILLSLFSLSGALELYAMERTRSSIEALMKLRPSDAWLLAEDGSEMRVRAEVLKPGDMIRVKPGELFPVDGIILEGETWADESVLTGESLPVAKQKDSQVFSGTLNQEGTVQVRVTNSLEDSAIERVVALVQQAQSEKTDTQRALEAWQKPYVIGVMLLSAGFFAWSLLVTGHVWQDALYHAMVLLVAASPCAVVISVPAVMLSTIARAARAGILFKSGQYVDTLRQIEVVAFDKTGTLTEGKFEVSEIWTPESVSKEALLELAAAVQTHSDHPLARSVVKEASVRGLNALRNEVVEVQSHHGLGIHANVDGAWTGIGREKLFEQHDVAIPPALAAQVAAQREKGQSVFIVIAKDRGIFGCIGVRDRIREEAANAISQLKHLGIRETLLLTGDNPQVGRAIGSLVGVDSVEANMLPEEKEQELRRRVNQGQRIAMVGDGVNDAPALASATLGIAMGGAGSDVALEVADVVLMADDLSGLPKAVRISQLAARRIRQNFAIAFCMIAVLLIATTFNLPLSLGVVGHEGSTVVVAFNGLRMLWQSLDN